MAKKKILQKIGDLSTIIALMFVILLAMGFLVILDYGFQPEDEICLEETKWCKGSLSIVFGENTQGTICYGEWIIRCEEWRDLTEEEKYCQDNPNDEGKCVCEEDIFREFRPCICRDDPRGRMYVGSAEKEYCKDVDCSMNYECIEARPITQEEKFKEDNDCLSYGKTSRGDFVCITDVPDNL